MKCSFRDAIRSSIHLFRASAESLKRMGGAAAMTRAPTAWAWQIMSGSFDQATVVILDQSQVGKYLPEPKPKISFSCCMRGVSQRLVLEQGQAVCWAGLLCARLAGKRNSSNAGRGRKPSASKTSLVECGSVDADTDDADDVAVATARLASSPKKGGAEGPRRKRRMMTMRSAAPAVAVTEEAGATPEILARRLGLAEELQGDCKSDSEKADLGLASLSGRLFFSSSAWAAWAAAVFSRGERHEVTSQRGWAMDLA
mmetsp:Transcript_77055/g.160362  ORF Transcript_77055/g.160362 Transcript_77055/m.160362 type:complete len:256 (+) Transcript_77055:849-1616(+)